MFNLTLKCYVIHACSLILPWSIILCWLDRSIFLIFVIFRSPFSGFFFHLCVVSDV